MRLRVYRVSDGAYYVEGQEPPIFEAELGPWANNAYGVDQAWFVDVPDLDWLMALHQREGRLLIREDWEGHASDTIIVIADGYID